MSGAHLFEVDGIRHVYGDHFLLDVPRLSVAPGSCVGLVGPNGSGKSTLLRILAFLEQPQRGRVSFDGEPVVRPRRDVTLLLQDPYLLHRTVFENVAFGLRARGERGGLHGRVREALELVGLRPASFERRRWHELSGGEAQRVALASRFVLSPRALLLDEPTARVDTQSSALIREAVAAFRRERRTTLVIASHDQLWLGEAADEIVRMSGGRIVGRGAGNVIGGPWEPGTDGLWWKRLPDGQEVRGVDAPDPEAKAFLDPSSIMVSAAQPAGLSAQNVLRGTVTGLEPEGAAGSLRLSVSVPGLALHCVVTRFAAQSLGLRPGRGVWVVFEASSLIWRVP